MGNIFKIIVLLFFFSFSTISCNREKENYDRFKAAVSLISQTKAINDSLIKFRDSLEVKFICCYISSTEKHELLSFVLLQTKSKQFPALKVDKKYWIENIQGIDILFKDHNDTVRIEDVKLNSKAQELLRKGYITKDNRNTLMRPDFIKFIFCKNNYNNYFAYDLNFLGVEENRLRALDKSFNEESYYPNCLN